MKVGLIDLFAISTYFVGIVCLGLWVSRRRARDGRDFFLAGRQMTWPFIGASLFATNISSQQFVGQAGLAFSVGIIAGGFQMIGALCFMFLAAFFLRTYMGLKLTTSPEFFERRFSSRCRMTHLLGWDTSSHANLLFWMAVVLIGVAAGTYTLLGGLKAVIYCDFVQMIVLVTGGALLLIFGVVKVGGISEVLSFRNAEGASMWTLAHPWYHEFGWLPMLTGTIVLGVLHGHCTDHDYIQRALSAQSLYHARMGAVFGGFLKILALFVIAAPGVVAAKLASKGVLNVQSGDSAYVAMLTGVMPTGLLGICLAGLLAAIMSSVDSGLCACGSLLTYDFFAKIKKTADDKELLRDGRIIMGVLLIGCIILAPSIRYFEGLFHYLLYVWALLAPPVFVCVVFGLYWRRASANGAFATLSVGCVLGLVAFAVLKFPFLGAFRESLPIYLQNKLNIGFINTVICSFVMLVVSHLSEHSEANQARAKSIRQSGQAMPMSDLAHCVDLFLLHRDYIDARKLLLYSPSSILCTTCQTVPTKPSARH
jgi:SSS family solute:Na+ symporter